MYRPACVRKSELGCRSLIWDWKIQQKTASEKIQQPHKIFLGELGVLFARVAIYLLNPFPGNSKPVAFEQLQDCAEATTELIPA
jgi:hypothetical protein